MGRCSKIHHIIYLQAPLLNTVISVPPPPKNVSCSIPQCCAMTTRVMHRLASMGDSYVSVLAFDSRGRADKRRERGGRATCCVSAAMQARNPLLMYA